MAINFPSNPTNAQEVTEGNVTYVYNATKGYWESSEGSSGGASITVYADMTALIAATGMSNGDQAFVTANNNLYLYSGSGWYKIATVQNDSPSAITGVGGTYSLAIDGTPTVITAVSTDPEGFPLTWSYSTSGLGSTATISQVDNVFTITPSTDDANAGTFTLTINATDGINGAVSANTSITLEFYITNSQYTTLLATAVDTSDNSSFTDSSTNTLTLSPINAPTSSSFSPYNDRYSAYMDGGDLYYLSSSADWNLGSSWTIEGWFYPTAQPTETCRIFMFGTNGGSAAMGIGLNSDMTWGGGGAFPNGAMFNLPQGYLNQWQHVAWVRDGSSNTGTIYVNGVASAGSYSGPAVQAAGNVDLKIGYDTVGTVAYQYRGYFADIRITKSAVYTANFTPPTERLSSSDVLTDTKLLAFNKPYLKDQSTSNHNISISAGNPRFKVFAPFERLAYKSSLNGGSLYFTTSGSTGTSGGSGQYVQSALSPELTLDTNDFTIDCWVYGISKARNYPRILQIGPQNTPWGSSQLALLYKHNDDNDSICLAMQGIGGNAMLIASGPIYDNAWYHVAVTRSESTFTLYINGESVGTYTSTGSATGTGDKAILIGSSSAGDSDFNGYISDLRIINGTVAYTGNFAPPTEPIGSSGADFHVIGTDASIIDKSQSTNLQLVGNTTGSTTQVKFADTKSMYFDGSGDYIKTSASKDYDLPTDFTIEAWIYPTALSSNRLIVDTYSASQAGSYQLYWRSTGGSLAFYTQADGVILQDSSGSNIQVNTWHHVAVTRSGSTFRMFVDGTQVNSTTFTRDLTHGIPVAIGYQQATNTNYFAGYMQDVRITKGLARYTANFTPPTESLKG
jgi:hypothetical protein